MACLGRACKPTIGPCCCSSSAWRTPPAFLRRLVVARARAFSHTGNNARRESVPACCSGLQGTACGRCTASVFNCYFAPCRLSDETSSTSQVGQVVCSPSRKRLDGGRHRGGQLSSSRAATAVRLFGTSTVKAGSLVFCWLVRGLVVHMLPTSCCRLGKQGRAGQGPAHLGAALVHPV